MQQDEKLKTGTTTVGLLFKDGVVLASDSKSTLGSLVASKTTQKIYQVDDKIAVTTAGGSGDTQALIRILKAEINLYKITRNKEFSVRSAVTLLSNILSNNRYYPYLAMLIVGGVDKDGNHIHSIDPVGGSEEEDKFTSTGSGSPFAYGVLEDSYKDNMSREEAVQLAINAVRAAQERDIFSGGRDIVLAVIDKSGTEILVQNIREISKK